MIATVESWNVGEAFATKALSHEVTQRAFVEPGVIAGLVASSWSWPTEALELPSGAMIR